MDKRNIVVILCDQLRPDFLPTYGCDAIKTPNIDWLSDNGVIFDRAITVSTVCAPARASMMTGRYVSDHEVFTNDVPFRDGIEYVVPLLNELGYATGAFGKLHHYPARDAKGFGTYIGMEENRLGKADDYFRFLKAKHPEAKSIFNYEDGCFIYEDEDYYEHFIASQAINFIDNMKEVPFLAWVSFQGPHGPFDPPKRAKGTVDETKIPEVIQKEQSDLSEVSLYRKMNNLSSKEHSSIMERRKLYLEMITEIDFQIGRIISHLNEIGKLDKTTFIFSADHGDLLGDYGLFAKGPYIYRGQLDIPLIVSNDPKSLKGTRCDSLTSNLDIPSTILDIAGANRGIGSSMSLLPLSYGNKSSEREVCFCEFCDSAKIAVTKDFRYIYFPFGDKDGFDSELYRDSDFEMRENLSGNNEFADVEKRMLKYLLDLQVLVRRPKIEAHDFVPSQQRGLSKLSPEYLRDFDIFYPVSNKAVIKKIKDEGLDSFYNAFCEDRKVVAAYGCYWLEND